MQKRNEEQLKCRKGTRERETERKPFIFVLHPTTIYMMNATPFLFANKAGRSMTFLKVVASGIAVYLVLLGSAAAHLEHSHANASSMAPNATTIAHFWSSEFPSDMHRDARVQKDQRVQREPMLWKSHMRRRE